MTEHKIEALKQRIYHLVEFRKMVITGIIIDLGGTATVAANVDNWIKGLLFLLGLMFFFFLWFLNMEVATKIENYINMIESEEN